MYGVKEVKPKVRMLSQDEIFKRTSVNYTAKRKSVTSHNKMRAYDLS